MLYWLHVTNHRGLLGHDVVLQLWLTGTVPGIPAKVSPL